MALVAPRLPLAVDCFCLSRQPQAGSPSSSPYNSSVQFLPQVDVQNPQVTWAYFDDSKEAQYLLSVTNSRDHNHPVMSETTHPRLPVSFPHPHSREAAMNDPLLASIPGADHRELAG